MGTVYRACDRILGREVAVKVLPLGRAADRNSVARFQREARAAAALCHPNVVSVFDAGSDESTRFIVMEYVHGVHLGELLSRRGPLPVAKAVDLGAQIARGLAAAHSVGIIHRDVKPANVMVDQSGTVKLLDFGIARARTDNSLTQTGSVLGSAHYIAPEVARGETAEERSDVYSLGCVIYEMVTGRPPFLGELDAALLHQHASARPRPAQTLVPGVPRELDELVMQMLAKRAAERPSAAQLTAALGRIAQGARTTRIPRAPDDRAGSHATEKLAVLERARRPRRVQLGLAAALIGALAAVGLAIGASLPDRGRSSSDNAASAAGPRGASAAKAKRQAGHLLPIGAAAFRDATGLVATAIAGLQAARYPAPAIVPPRKAAPPRKPHPPRAHGKRDRGRGPQRSHTQSETSPPPSSEVETPVEVEAPAAGGQATPPAEAPAPQSPPPAATSPPAPPPAR
jgi:eukaryotic-like serine/threonine-protein kinase